MRRALRAVEMEARLQRRLMDQLDSLGMTPRGSFLVDERRERAAEMGAGRDELSQLTRGGAVGTDKTGAGSHQPALAGLEILGAPQPRQRPRA